MKYFQKSIISIIYTVLLWADTEKEKRKPLVPGETGKKPTGNYLFTEFAKILKKKGGKGIENFPNIFKRSKDDYPLLLWLSSNGTKASKWKPKDTDAFTKSAELWLWDLRDDKIIQQWTDMLEYNKKGIDLIEWHISNGKTIIEIEDKKKALNEFGKEDLVIDKNNDPDKDKV